MVDVGEKVTSSIAAGLQTCRDKARRKYRLRGVSELDGARGLTESCEPIREDEAGIGLGELPRRFDGHAVPRRRQ